MANRNVNILLRLQDKFTKPLEGTRKEINKQKRQIQAATKIINRYADSAFAAFKKVAKASAVGTAGLATAFVAAEGATEEYRTAMGKLNTAFQASGLGTEAATQSYQEFYKILGDTDTATEASQLLSQLTQSEEDLTEWTRIAAGVNGTFGDSLPIEGLIEAANETQNTGKVTGVLADALNWVGISEDDFNDKLAACGSTAERNQIIMETLGTTYEDAADAFYKNNEALVQARNRQVVLQQVTGKLGEASASAKNKIMEMLGATADGGIAEGSVLDKLLTKLEEFKAKLDTVDLSQYAETASAAFDKVAGAIQFVLDHANLLIPILSGIVGGFTAFNILSKIIPLVSTLSTVLKGASVAGGLVNAVVLANPLLWIAGVIAIVIAAGVALYKNWDWVKGMAEKLNTGVQKAFGAIHDKIVDVFEGIKKKVKPVFEWFGEKFEWISEKVSGVTGFFSSLGGGSSVAGHATGTPYFAGGMTSINEGGRGEIVTLPSGTQIIPHDVAVKSQGGQSVVVNLTVQGNVIGNRTFMEQTGDYIVRKILTAQGVV